MTWTIKHKRSPGSLIVAEYLCPVHGRFEREVERDANGDPPEELPCPHAGEAARCPCGAPLIFGVCSSLGCFREPRPVYCGLTAPHVISAPARCRVQRVTAARRGKDPEPPPGAMDWQALAYDEMSPEEWEAKERKRDFEDVRRITKKALA